MPSGKPNETPVESHILWLDAPGKFAVRTEALPSPGGRQILCATLVTAISPGTELAAVRGLPHLRQGVTYPRLLGYCNVAEVVAAGPDADAQVGERVLTHQSHRSHFICDETDVLLKLDQGQDAREKATLYLFHLGFEAAHAAGVRMSARVAIIGLGTLGLTAVACCALAGAEVVAVSDHASAADRARTMGASSVWSRRESEREVQADQAQFDVVIVTTNGWQDWETALRLAGLRGVIACLGFPGRGEPAPTFNPLSPEHFYAKQLTIRAVGHAAQQRDKRGFLRFNERDNLAFLSRAMDAGRLNADFIIADTVAAVDAPAAYERLLHNRSAPGTFLLDWRL